MAHFALAASRIATSLYALSLHASAFTVGLLLAVFALFPMLYALRSGRWVDRIGSARPMMVGAMALILGGLLAAIASALAWLFLSAALVGTGFMLVQVAAQHHIGAISSNERRAANFNFLSLGFSISGFSGPVLAGMAIDFAGHAAAYLMAALAAAIALLLAAVRAHDEALPLASGETNIAPPARAFELLGRRRMRDIYAAGILLAAAWDLFTFVLPIHGARLGYPAATIGFILGCFAAATFAVRLVMPWLMRRFNEWEILLAALALAALCYTSFPLLHGPLALMLAAAGLGIAVGASQPNMLALLHRSAPPGRAGEALGLRIMMGNASQVALPLAFGAAGAVLGIGIVFWGMALLLVSGLPLAWRRARRH